MGVNKVSMTKMNVYLQRHYIKIEDEAELESAWQMVRYHLRILSSHMDSTD